MSNLLKDASILLTPTAYDNGKMLAVKPEIVLGEENVTNGDFATDSDWSKGSGVTISGGEALITVTNGGYQFLGQSVTYISGKSYTLTASVNGTIGKGCTFFDASGNNGGLNTSNGIVTFNGEKQYISFDFIANNNSNTVLITRNGTGDYSFTIDNVSVKEDVSGDFTFSRNSAATRVNAQGLVENVQILSSNLVSNGDFSQEGVQEVSNGSFSQEGSEQVTNGDFATDSNWSMQASWSIANGSANFDGLASHYIQQSNVFAANTNYKLTFTISNNTSGIISIRDGAAAVLVPNTNYSNGTYTFYITSTANTSLKIFGVGGSGSVSIDNVSVKEVGQDWTLGPGWSIGEDKAIQDGTGSNFSIEQASVFVVGKQYKVNIEVSTLTQGQLEIYAGYPNTNIKTINSVGSYTFYIEGEGNGRFYVKPINSFTGSITNISVKEVGQNWTLGTGWSIGDGVANVNYTSLADMSQNIGSSLGKTYKIAFEVSNYVSGSVKVLLGYGSSPLSPSLTVSANGIYEVEGTPNAINPQVLYVSTKTATTQLSITNISIIEITTDTNLPRINYEGFSYQDSFGSEEVVNGDFSNGSANWFKGSSTTISNGEASFNGALSYLYQNILTIGKTYRCSVNVKNWVSGAVFSVGSSATGGGTIYSGITLASNTKTTFTFVAVSTTLGIGSRSFPIVGSIDNVSVKEVTQEVVPNSGCGSWLMEPQSTNLISYSELFSDAYWTKTNSSVTSGFTSPSGDTSAFKLVEANFLGQHALRSTVTTTGTSFSTSLFCKIAERDEVFLQVLDGTINLYVYYNLSYEDIHLTL